MRACCEMLGDVECGPVSSWSSDCLEMTCRSSARTCCDFVLCGVVVAVCYLRHQLAAARGGERVRVREWTEVSWTVRGRCDNSEEGCWPHALRTSSTLHSTTHALYALQEMILLLSPAERYGTSLSTTSFLTSPGLQSAAVTYTL